MICIRVIGIVNQAAGARAGKRAAGTGHPAARPIPAGKGRAAAGQAGGRPVPSPGR